MGLFGKSKREKFIEANQVASDKAPLLVYGALLLEFNRQPTSTLALPEPDFARMLLEQFWEVENKADTLTVLEWLLGGGDHKDADPILAGYLGGDKSAFNHEAATVFDAVQDWLAHNDIAGTTLSEQDLAALTTIAAWDIERAAAVARCAYNAGYLSEAETWKVLEQIDKRVAKAGFKNWAQYAASYVYGRSLIMVDSGAKDTIDFVNDARKAGEGADSVWQRYPRR